MNKIDYQALRAKAEKATCGEWSLEYGEGRFDGDDALIHREAAGYLPICRIEGAHPESGFDEDFQMEQQANAEFIAAANPSTVLALLDELEAADKELSTCKSIMEKIKSTSCHVDTSKGAFIPNSLDAWGRPVPQYLPYDFSGTPGASATQYCNGWNDAGGYWLNHVKYLQECITAAGIITKVGE